MPSFLVKVAAASLLLLCGSKIAFVVGEVQRSCDEVIGVVTKEQLVDAVRLFAEPLIPDPEELDATVRILTLPVAYDVKAVKLCASCASVKKIFIDNKARFSQEFLKYCAPTAYGYGDLQSTLVLLPIDPENNNDNNSNNHDILTKTKLRAFLNLHASRTDVSTAPTEAFPTNLTAMVSSVRAGRLPRSKFQWFMTDVLVALIAASTGAVGIVPDLQGYGESQATVNRTTFFYQGYQQAAIAAFFRTEDYVSKSTGGCTKMQNNTVAIAGLEDGGYAVPVVGESFRLFNAKPVILFSGAAPLNLEVFLRDAVTANNETITDIPLHGNRLGEMLALTAFSYSADTPGYANTLSQQRMVSPSWRNAEISSKNLVHWFSGPFPKTEISIAQALPNKVRKTVSPNLRQLFKKGKLIDDAHPCQSAALIQDVGDVDQLCAAIVDSSSWSLLDRHLGNGWTIPLQLCYSPADEVVNAETQYPVTILNHERITTYPGPPGSDALRPTKDHALAVQQCVIAPILYLNLGGVMPADETQRINYQENLSAAELATCEPATSTITPVIVSDASKISASTDSPISAPVIAPTKSTTDDSVASNDSPVSTPSAAPTKKPTLDAAASTKSPVASPTIPSSGNSHATSGSFGSSISLLTISLATILWYGFAALPVL